MTATDNDFPFLAGERPMLAVLHALVCLRQFANDPAEHAEILAVQRYLFLGKTGVSIEPNPFLRRLVTCIAGEYTAHHVLLACHPEVHVEFAHEPTSTTDMIGVQVRRNYMCCRITSHGAGKRRSPDIAAGRDIDAGIDDDPAPTIAQQPQVDVVQGHRQRHVQPCDAIRHGDSLAGLGARTVLVLNPCHRGILARQPVARISRTACSLTGPNPLTSR